MLTSLLSKLLEKKGINNLEELSKDELETIKKYQVILSGENLTVDTIKQFCQQQIRVIEGKFAEGDTTNDVYYKACLHVYLNILKVIEAPEQERASLERHLNQLIS